MLLVGKLGRCYRIMEQTPGDGIHLLLHLSDSSSSIIGLLVGYTTEESCLHTIPAEVPIRGLHLASKRHCTAAFIGLQVLVPM